MTEILFARLDEIVNITTAIGAGSDLTGTYQSPFLKNVISAAGPIGSATVVPIITYDAKGRLTTVTSATITPAVGSITGLGTGVATALAVAIGSAGAPVVFGGALGTPSSGVATNLTGTASGLTAGHVTTNANLTGDATSVGNAVSIARGDNSSFGLMRGDGVTITCVLGTCTTIGAAATSIDASGATTSISNGVTNNLLYDLGGFVKVLATANSSILVTNGSGAPSWSTTLPAHTLGGTISGGGNQINNVIIGNSTPLAGAFTTLSASSTLAVAGASTLTGGAVLPGATNQVLLTLTNTSGGATNPNKYFRLSAAGSIQLLNSAANVVLLTLQDDGSLVSSGSLASQSGVSSFQGTTASTDPTTGTLVIGNGTTGGLGVGGAGNFGGTVTAKGLITNDPTNTATIQTSTNVTVAGNSTTILTTGVHRGMYLITEESQNGHLAVFLYDAATMLKVSQSSGADWTAAAVANGSNTFGLYQSGGNLLIGNGFVTSVNFRVQKFLMD